LGNAALLRLLGAVFFCVAGVGATSAAHPLDALSAEELVIAVAVLREAGDADSATRFALIGLDEPDKAKVLAWQPGQPFARKAFVIARRNRTVYEGTVDLAARRVESWEAKADVQTAATGREDWTKAKAITIADPGWQAAMRQRGYDTIAPEKLFCAPFPAGYLGDPTEAGRRLLRVSCFDTSTSSNNIWGRPIEGLHTVVDLDEARVLRLVDTGPVPLSRETHSFEGTQPSLARPLADAHTRSGIVLDGDPAGRLVQWKNWSFHYRMDRRAGLIVSLVRYRDGDRDRLVLYRGSIAELFVPYMDSDPNWAFRTWLDVGENDFGFMASELRPGIDCPADAAFLNALLPDSRSDPVQGASVVCLFARDTGAPLWRHAEAINRSYAGRPAAELVLRTIETVGNYDYVIDWVLTETGSIRIDVGATGIDEVKGVAARNMADLSSQQDTASGMLVAPNLVGINHDHFLSFRLDVDIDGSANTLLRQRLVPQPAAGDTGRRSLWAVTEEAVGAEGPVSADEHGGAEVWHIVNPNVTNGLGQAPGYELRPGHSATSLLSPDDWPQRRAAFSSAPLWVTAYDPRELYAAGLYPNQSRGGDGLPTYAARHRPVDNADLVLWVTMGFHHLPRPEDWPVLPTMWHSVALVPYGFFDRNPSAQAPRESAPDRAGK
jgi:primary-amine oxidase